MTAARNLMCVWLATSVCDD